MRKTKFAMLVCALLTVCTIPGVANAAPAEIANGVSPEVRVSGPCNPINHYRPPCHWTGSGGTGSGSSRAGASGGTGDSSDAAPGPIWCPGPQAPKIADDGTKYCPPV
jgi:hypothetical protein